MKKLKVPLIQLISTKIYLKSLALVKGKLESNLRSCVIGMFDNLLDECKGRPVTARIHLF